jgi:PhnB protein
MKMHTYLNYGGNCAEAFKFYEKHLGGKIGMMMTHADSPGPSNVPEEWKNTVLHAQITIGEALLMGADIPSYKPMRSAYLSLSVDSDAEAERIYGVLSEGGEIFMPMQEAFFATRFAQLRDKFGTSWMIIHERPMPSQG